MHRIVQDGVRYDACMLFRALLTGFLLLSCSRAVDRRMLIKVVVVTMFERGAAQEIRLLLPRP